MKHNKKISVGNTDVKYENLKSVNCWDDFVVLGHEVSLEG